jgi:hypothetical protein
MAPLWHCFAFLLLQLLLLQLLALELLLLLLLLEEACEANVDPMTPLSFPCWPAHNKRRVHPVYQQKVRKYKEASLPYISLL